MKTRLAPSPTGALHLGNARTFLVNWALGRQNGWHIALRIDDLDGPRVKPWATDAALRDLRWLGIDWDEELPLPSTRIVRYGQAMEQLRHADVFICSCSRSDVEAASPGRAPDGSPVYGGNCIGRPVSDQTSDCLRIIGNTIDTDRVLIGSPSSMSASTFGPFVIRRTGGEPSYQWTSTIDDHDFGITHVIRGNDLTVSSARQTYLRQQLWPGLQPLTHWHLPLIVGPDGRKLAKRHGDTRLSHLREAGWTPDRVRGLCGTWTGIATSGEPMSSQDWVERLHMPAIPPESAVFDPAAHGLSF